MTTKPETQGERFSEISDSELLGMAATYGVDVTRISAILEFSRSLLRKSALLADGKAGGEVVAWQMRKRAVCIDSLGVHAWTDWQECLEHFAKVYLETPIYNGVEYEVRSLYTRPQPAAQVAQPMTPIQVRDGIADWLEANMAHREFWTPEIVALIRSIEINGIGKDQA